MSPLGVFSVPGGCGATRAAVTFSLPLRCEPGVDILAYEHIPRDDLHIPETLEQVIAARLATAIARAVNHEGRSAGQRASLQQALLVGW